MDDIDYKGVVTQLQLENEELRRSLATLTASYIQEVGRVYSRAVKSRLLLAAVALAAILAILYANR